MMTGHRSFAGPLIVATMTAALFGCSANSGPSDGATQTIIAAAKPSAVLVISPDSLSVGQSATAVWSTTGASSCKSTGSWSGALPLSSTGTAIGPLQQPGTYSFGLSCTGKGGAFATSQTVTVGQVPPPTLQLDIYPTSIQPGDSALIVWSSANATSCTGSAGTGSDGWQGSQPINTSAGFNTGPIATAGQYEYNLTCLGPNGTTQQSRILSVSSASPAAPPSVTFAAQPALIQLGQSSSFTWSTTNATACTASGGSGSDGWNGTQQTASNGTNVGPTSNIGIYSYTLTCSGPGGSAAKTLTVIVGGLAPAPTVYIDVSPTQIVAGNSAMLTWSTANADSCTASGSWSGSQPLLGTNVSTGTLNTAGLYTYALTCTGTGGSVLASAPLLVTPAAPVVSIISANPTTVLNGGSTTLQWVAVGATACTASGGTGSDGWSGPEPVVSTGTTVGPISPAGTYTYTLICNGLGGSSSPQSVNVTASSPTQPPAMVTSFFVTPSTTIQVLQSASLSWSSSGASSCTATGGTGADGWNGSVGTASSGTSTGLIVSPGTYTYTLTCTGAGGTGAASSVVLNVIPVAQLAATVTSFNASPTNIQTGQSSSLSWTSSNSTSCAATGGTGSDGWHGSVGTTGAGFNTGAINAPGSYTYTLTCSDAGVAGSPSSVVVNVSSAPPPAAAIASFSAVPGVLVSGLSTSLSWQSTSASSCAATGGSGSDSWSGAKPTSSTGTVIGPLTAGNYIYTLTCTGPGGTSAPSSVSVDVVSAPPIPNIGLFTAVPPAVETGGSTTLTWTVLDATACTASGGTGSDGWSGSVGTTGAGTLVGPIAPAGSYNYTLTCVGPGGTTSNSVTVNATDAPLPATILAFVATPAALQTGQSTLLTWASANSTGCTAGGGGGSAGWGGAVSTTGVGTSIGPFATAGTHIFTLSCAGTGGNSQTSTATVTVTNAAPAASIVSLLATPSVAITGQSILLTWVTSGASACTASGGTGSDGWHGSEPTSSVGTVVGPINSAGTYVYTLNCTGPGGASAPMSTSVTVSSATPAPTVGSFTATPSVVSVGQTSSLAWSSSGATSCAASGGSGSDSWPGTVGTSSTGTVEGPYAAAGSVSYTLTCTGTGGTSAPSTATVTVNPAAVGQPTVALSANGNNPAQVQPGSSLTLSWSSTNATSCAASGGTGSDGWSGSKPITSSGIAVGPIATPGIYTYTLTCTGSGGSGGGSVQVTVISSSSADCGVPGVPTTALLSPAATVGDTVDGICLGCGVTGIGNVINGSTTSPSAIATGVGLLGGGVTLAVSDTATSFPAGRQAGFMVTDGSSPLALSALGNVSLVTYLHGSVQETATTGNNLLKVQALGLLSIGATGGYLGFTTTKPFDEVTVSVQQIASVLTTVNVYRACVSLK